MGAGIVASSASSAAERSPRFSVVPLGTPRIENGYFFPWLINNRSDIVGVGRSNFLLYRDGVIHDLGKFEAPVSYGTIMAINDRGAMLGFTTTTLGSFMSFLLPASKPPLPVTDARVLPVSTFLARDINNHGTIVGWVYNAEQDRTFPVIYDSGRITELHGLVPGGRASALAINNHAQVLGESAFPGTDNPYAAHAVIWSDGQIKDLGVLPGHDYSFAYDINDHGEAVGHCVDENFQVHSAFVYRGGVMEQLPAPAIGVPTFPTDINDAGDVLIGTYLEGDPNPSYWLYSDGALHDLTAVVARATGWPVFWLVIFDMNDRGQIVGTAHYHNGRGGYGIEGVLLTPNYRRR
jgi:probable HAF family extracellular repeat protein